MSHSLSSAHFTLHGFRSGAAVSLALAGLSLHEIMDHVSWKNNKIALHYTAGAAAKLAGLDIETGKTYKRLNNLKDFSQAFQD